MKRTAPDESLVPMYRVPLHSTLNCPYAVPHIRLGGVVAFQMRTTASTLLFWRRREW